MQIPTLEVDAETYQLVSNYINNWVAFLDKNLADYNISNSESAATWCNNLEFSNQQRKVALRFLLAGMSIKPLPFSE